MKRRMEYCIVVSKQISLPSCLLLKVDKEVKKSSSAECTDCIWENARREDIVPSQEVKTSPRVPNWANYQYAKKAFEASAKLHIAARRLLLVEADRMRRDSHVTLAVREEAEKYYRAVYYQETNHGP